MKSKLLLAIATLFSLGVFAQDNAKTEIKITGKPIVTIFTNYQAGLGHANDLSGFNLDRAYLGYDFKVTPDLGGKVVFDIGSSKVSGSDLERIAYVKHAMLS